MKAFKNVPEREILAIAIAVEGEGPRIYQAFAEDLAERYPSSAKVFEETGADENEHRRWLLELYSKRVRPTCRRSGATTSRGF